MGNASCAKAIHRQFRLGMSRVILGLALQGLAVCTWAGAAATPWRLHDRLDLPETLRLSGSARARYETLDGQSRVGLDASPDMVSLRTTMFAEYAANSLRIGAELYDSRAYFGDAGSGVSANEVNAMELVQAYVARDFKGVLGTRVDAAVQVGRFTLNLGSRRLVAADDYRNTTNGYTGFRFDFKAADTGSATLIYTLPQRRLPDDLPSIEDNEIQLDRESAALALWGGIATFPGAIGGVALEGAFFRLDEEDSRDLATRDRRLNTSSLRVFRDPAENRWDFEVEGAYQNGSVSASMASAAAALDVSAYFYHLEAGYQWSGGWRPRLSVQYDRVSGDDGKSNYGRFDTLFGMRRADFAPSGIYNSVGRANLSSPGVHLEAIPGPRLDLLLDYRALWLDSRTDSFSTTGVRDASGQSGDFAGHQVDSRVRYWLVPQFLRLEGDVVLLFKSRFLRDAPNAPPTGDTHYASVNLTATF